MAHALCLIFFSKQRSQTCDVSSSMSALPWSQQSKQEVNFLDW
jgi:hypothetical protein